MKQITITIAALMMLFTTTLFAQKTEEKLEKEPPKHELSVDVLELLLFKKLEFSYDYMLNDSESIGTTISILTDRLDFWEYDGIQEDFSLSFDYKHYFSKKHAQGFYVEGFLKYSNGKSFKYNVSEYRSLDYQRLNTTDIGIGIGYKYISKRNFFVDINARISRKLVDFNSVDSNYSNPKFKSGFSLSVGKRF